MKRPILLSTLLFALAACPGADPPAAPSETVGRVAGPLSMPNGPGLSANGPGLSANGPGLSQNYDSAEAKQAAVGLAYVRLDGAKTVEGAPLHSLALVKGELRGTRQDGTRLHGVDFAGVELRARGLKKDGMLADGTTEEGEPARPKERVVRVESATPVVPGTFLQDSDFYHYSVRVKDPITGEFVDPCEGSYAIALVGRWDHRRNAPPQGTDPGGGSYDPDDRVFTFACQRTAVQKCAEAAHYKPWQTIRGPMAQNCDPVESADCARAWTLAGADALRACVRLVRGDFCGDGTPLTLDGTLIDGNDNFPDDGIEPDAPDHPDWPIEAGWDANGATCVDQFRITNAINTHLDGTCKQRLSGTNVGCKMEDVVLNPFASRAQPVLLNRSQRKMNVYRPAEPQAYAHYGFSAAVHVDAPRKQQLLAISAPSANSDRGVVHLFRVSTAPENLGSREFVTTFAAPAALRLGELFGKTLAFRAGPSGPDLLVGAVRGYYSLAVPGAVWVYPFAGWAGDKPSFGEPIEIASPASDSAYFGYAMVSTPDGRTFISAPYEGCPGGAPEGGAVFVLEPGGLTPERLLNPTCPAGWQAFGISLRALDDSSVLSSTNYETTPMPECPLGYTKGVVRRYQRQADGSYAPTWRLHNPDCAVTANGYNPGFGLAERVGHTLVIGSQNAHAHGVQGWGRLHVYDYAADTTPTYRGPLEAPEAGEPGAFGLFAAGYTANGSHWLAVPHIHGDGLYFFRESAGQFLLENRRLRDPFGPTGKSIGSPIIAAPPFLYFGSYEATEGTKAEAGYFFHFNFDDEQPTPLSPPHP